jgi:peptidoglycan/xylan/chitin deacetylase (PgdA/CDA1 family)
MRVALTFDAEHADRPHSPPGNEDRVLATLAEHGIAGTFFVQGRWAIARPEVARRIAADGTSWGTTRTTTPACVS